MFWAEIIRLLHFRASVESLAAAAKAQQAQLGLALQELRELRDQAKLLSADGTPAGACGGGAGSGFKVRRRRTPVPGGGQGEHEPALRRRGRDPMQGQAGWLSGYDAGEWLDEAGEPDDVDDWRINIYPAAAGASSDWADAIDLLPRSGARASVALGGDLASTMHADLARTTRERSAGSRHHELAVPPAPAGRGRTVPAVPTPSLARGGPRSPVPLPSVLDTLAAPTPAPWPTEPVAPAGRGRPAW